MNKENLANSLVVSIDGNEITLESGHGDLFPAAPFHVTASPQGEMSNSLNSEILRVDGVTGDVFTVVRAQRGTDEQDIAPGWVIGNGVYVEDIPETFDDLSDGSTNKAFTSTEKTKLSNVESGAQVNTVTSVASKTGAVTLAKGDVGLGNVDNTSDINKPISTATQSALDGKVSSATTETVTVSSTEPSSPAEGDVWFDTTRKIGRDDIDWTTFMNGKIEVQYSTGSISAVSGTVVTDTVTFSEAFSGTPTVFIQPNTGQATAIQTVYAATNVSSTGFTVNARHPSASGAVTYRWIAVYANFS